MTQTPFIDEEELKRLEAQEAEEAAAIANVAPTPETVFKTPTAAENKAAGNTQPIGNTSQGMSQLGLNSVGDQIKKAVANPGEALRTVAEGAFAAPMGALDFGMDAIGRIPGAEHIDDAWDKHTKFKNPLLQKLREVASIVVPSIGVGFLTGGASAAVTAGGLARGLTALGVAAGGDVAVNLISDQSEGETLSTFVKEAAPWMPVPEALIVTDGDSPEVRRQKNIYESAGLSVVGDLIGYAFNAGKPIMDWFKPNDETAKAFKASEALTNADTATATRLSELGGQRSQLDVQGQQLQSMAPTSPEEALQQSVDLAGLSKAYKGLDKEASELTSEYLSSGASRLTQSPAESYIERMQISRDLQIDDVGKSRLMEDPTGAGGTDPFITPNLFPEGSSASFSVSPGNVARNMVDTTAIKLGNSPGSPAPMFSERAYYDLAKGDLQSRDIIFDLAEATRAAGDFDAVVDGFRYTKAQMSEAAWKIYSDIVGTRSVTDLQKLFMENRDVKNLLDGRKFTYINDTQAEAVAYALRDLTDKYIGRTVNEASARAMDTVGREISDIAEGYKALPEVADFDRTTEMIADRVGFLMQEYAINKYIAGWALKTQDRWKEMYKAAPDRELVTKELIEQFDLKVDEKRLEGQGYANMIKRITTEKPEAAQALVDAFAVSKGDVDTLDKLMKWASDQVSPSGLLASADGNVNAFAQGAWAVRYANVLSGLSAARAAVGNSAALILRPINSYVGTGLGMMLGRNSIDDLKRVHYIYSGAWNTNSRALGDAWNTFKRKWNYSTWGNDPTLDPRTLARDDLIMDSDPGVWEALGNMEKVWEKNGDTGKLFQYRMSRALYDLGNWRFMKYGTIAMEGADAFVNTTLAVQMARARAYDEVIGMGFKGKELADRLAKAENVAYGQMFDAVGKPTDALLKHASGEVALNLDDNMATMITMATNKVPLLKGFFMFPKTGVNGVKLAMSYTPIATLPGMNKYSKVLWAGDDIDKIKTALLEHGVDFDKTPNAMAVFKGLEAEYRGRVAFGGLVTTGLLGFALSGNIRGNGPVNESERKKLRDNGKWNPKTINIGGNWVSYAGIEPLDTLLSLVGDLAYYSTDIGSTLTEDIGSKIAWSLSATFVNKTWTQGLDPILSIIDGDMSRLTRHLANEVRAYIPLSGALGVASNAITSSQKDIHNDLIGYVKNRLPGFSSTLPEQIDIYTGSPLNDIDNPILRALNAINPVKISEGTEPWRQWLIDSGWDGVQMIRKDSTGNHEYTPKEREILYKYIGEQQIWKEFDRLSKNKKYNDQLDRVRAMRVEGRTSEEVDAAYTEVYGVMNSIMTDAQKAAELRLQNENQAMWNSIQESIRNKNYMQQGRVDDAARAADRRKAEIEKLTQSYR